MTKVILFKVNLRSYFREKKLSAAEEKVNTYIRENNLNVASVSLFKENDDEYIFTLTCL